MTCCCNINTSSPCTIDEAVKNALQVGGVTAPIRTGGLAHQDAGFPVIVLEVLNPTSPRAVCDCIQWNSQALFRVFSTTKEQGVDLANQATSIIKNESYESQSGNFKVLRASPPAQLMLSEELFLTRVNLPLVIWVPR